MMTAVTDANAQVAVGVLVFVAAMVTLLVQNRRGIKAQRGDHALTAEKVDRLLADLVEARQDRHEMKADIRDIKDEVRSHGGRLSNLEHMAITQDHTDRTVQANTRKLQQIQDHQNKEQAS